jgi:thymidylate synthase (FAD)
LYQCAQFSADLAQVANGVKMIMIGARAKGMWDQRTNHLRERSMMPAGETELELEIIREPKVYLLGRQTVDEQALAAFLSDHEVDHWTTDTDVAGEKLIETAGRVCYMSFQRPRPGGNHAYIGHLLEVGHGSVLEHAVFNLLITGVSRSLTHELVRHRAGFGFSQLSQRFVDESKCAFIEPSDIAADPELHQIWLEAMRASQAAYRALADRLTETFKEIPDRTLRRKKAREAARSVLPNATETKIFVTANARALRHFIEMRGDAAADVEIRRLAIAVFKRLRSEAPNLFGDYSLLDLPEGGQAVTTAHRKV